MNLDRITHHEGALQRFLRRHRIRVSLLINQTVGQPNHQNHRATHKVCSVTRRRRHQITMLLTNLLRGLTPNIFNVTRSQASRFHLLVINQQHFTHLHNNQHQLLIRLPNRLSRGLRQILTNSPTGPSSRRSYNRTRALTTAGTRPTTATTSVVTPNISRIITTSTFFP